jgi:hypothetical protein
LSVSCTTCNRLVLARRRTSRSTAICRTDALGLAPSGRSQIEAVAALITGVSFLRHRIESPGLRQLNADQLTKLLTPAIQALLDAAPTNRSPE